jgi:hypothetical protein
VVLLPVVRGREQALRPFVSRAKKAPSGPDLIIRQSAGWREALATRAFPATALRRVRLVLQWAAAESGPGRGSGEHRVGASRCQRRPRPCCQRDASAEAAQPSPRPRTVRSAARHRPAGEAAGDPLPGTAQRRGERSRARRPGFLPVLRPAVHAATSLGAVLLARLPGRRSPSTPFCNGSSATRRHRLCAETGEGYIGSLTSIRRRRWRHHCNAKGRGHRPRPTLAQYVAHQVCGWPSQRHGQPHPRQGLLEASPAPRTAGRPSIGPLAPKRPFCLNGALHLMGSTRRPAAARDSSPRA